MRDAARIRPDKAIDRVTLDVIADDHDPRRGDLLVNKIQVAQRYVKVFAQSGRHDSIPSLISGLSKEGV